MIDDEMMTEISVQEFRNTGMLLYINQVMQPFGLSLAIKDDELVPVKSRFRGFSEEAVDISYQKLNNYLKDNIEDITNI